jgi:hypothetical protein
MGFWLVNFGQVGFYSQIRASGVPGPGYSRGWRDGWAIRLARRLPRRCLPLIGSSTCATSNSPVALGGYLQRASVLGDSFSPTKDLGRRRGPGLPANPPRLGNSERRARERIRTSEGIRTVSKPPLLDLREIDDETSAFAPAGFCPWCDSRRSWDGRAFRRLKRTVAPQRRAKREALSPRR